MWAGVWQIIKIWGSLSLGGDKNFWMNTAACRELPCLCASLVSATRPGICNSTETFTKNGTHHALSEALRREHIPTVITTLPMHRASSVWEYSRRNNPSSPGNCVYPGWRRRASHWARLSPSLGPPLPPSPVAPDIVGYFKPQVDGVFTSL